MALLHCDFYSTILGMSSSMEVILPQRGDSLGTAARRPASKGLQSLLLLHGLSDDHTAWTRRTAIERYAAPLGLAVIMPNVHRSFYADMHAGPRYWSFITEELPQILHQFFPLSQRREDRFVAGLSMGGYGAFKLALNHPDQFAAAASLSGVTDLVGFSKTLDPRDGTHRDLQLVFGNTPIAGSNSDLIACAERLASSRRPAPKLYQWCGTEDTLHAGNITFRNKARRLKLPLTYRDGPGGHAWQYWDDQIQRVLEWLPLK